MFASTKLIAAFSVVAAAASAVFAAPAVFSPSGAKLDIVYRPQLTAPVAGDSWPMGSEQTVTWDVSDIPPEAIYQTGILLLGHVEEGSSDEHLDIRECFCICQSFAMLCKPLMPVCFRREPSCIGLPDQERRRQRDRAPGVPSQRLHRRPYVSLFCQCRGYRSCSWRCFLVIGDSGNASGKFSITVV